MPVNDEKKVGLQFIRDFYRGTSAYADHVDEELLSYIHLTTKLDEAIIKAAKDGKDIVLTGNPGDGKHTLLECLNQSLSIYLHQLLWNWMPAHYQTIRFIKRGLLREKRTPHCYSD